MSTEIDAPASLDSPVQAQPPAHTVTRWLAHRVQPVGPEAAEGAHPQPWWKVMALTTVLIPPAEFEEGGQVNGRAWRTWRTREAG